MHLTAIYSVHLVGKKHLLREGFVARFSVKCRYLDKKNVNNWL